LAGDPWGNNSRTIRKDAEAWPAAASKELPFSRYGIGFSIIFGKADETEQ
jgi:hypothetical protein